jgi:hypothetical protein
VEDVMVLAKNIDQMIFHLIFEYDEIDDEDKDSWFSIKKHKS